MGLSRLRALRPLLLTVAMLASPLYSDDPYAANHILFLLKRGHIERALNSYEEMHASQEHHDYNLIQEMGLLLLEEGLRQESKDAIRMALFGAGIAMQEKAIALLEEAIQHPSPEIQATALQLLSRYPRDDSEKLLRPLLHSTNLLLRLEALFFLAEEKNPAVLPHAETLMNKLPEPLHFLFPRLFAMVGTPTATKGLRRLFLHSDEGVRTAAVLSAASFERDDLLPDITRLCNSPNFDQQEACAIALSQFHDNSVIPTLRNLTLSKEPLVSLAAHYALCTLGERESRSTLVSHAREGNLYAIVLLGHVDDAENALATLLHHEQRTIRLNAMLSLLRRKDRRCLAPLQEFLLLDVHEWAVVQHTSHSGSLKAWKQVPTPGSETEEGAIAMEMTVRLREEALQQALHLPEEDFLSLTRLLFERQQNDLVPCVITLLEQLASPAAIALLKEQQQRCGAPLIRNYSNLALFRLHEEGPYGAQLREWVEREYHESFIEFRPTIPLPLREMGDSYSITPEERSRLLIEAFATFAQTQDEEGINLLFDAIRQGNPINRYALAGLLMRATQ